MLFSLLTIFTLVNPPYGQDPVGIYWERIAAMQSAAEVQATLTAEPQHSEIEIALAYARVFEISRAESDGAAAERLTSRLVEGNPNALWPNFAHGHVLAIKAPKKFPMRASKFLEKALDLDPMHIPSAASLAQLAVTSREKKLLEAAQESGNRIARVNRNPVLLTLLAEVAREQGDIETAERLATQVIIADPSSARGRYNLAVAQLATPRTRVEGYKNYLLAADERDTTMLTLMRFEMSRVGAPDDIPDLVAAEKPSELIEKFWTLRAVRDGRSPSDRLAEHYRRISHVREKFHAKNGITFAVEAIDWTYETNFGYDDRGRVYIRYGEPTNVFRNTDSRVFVARPQARASSMSDATSSRKDYFETWVYEIPGRERIIFHFDLTTQAGRGFVLTTVPGCGAWLSNLLHLGGQYQLLAAKCGSGSAPAWSVGATVRALDEWYKEQARHALTSDSHAPVYKKVLAADIDVYAFRSAEGYRDYALAVAVPATDAIRAIDGSYHLKVSFAVADTVMGIAERIDTTIARRFEQRLNRNDFLRTVGQFTLKEAHAPFYRVDVASNVDEEFGRAAGGNLQTYLTTGFDVSDVVLADTAEGGTFVRGSTRLNVVPSRVFGSAAFRVFYEIYGMKPGGEYETQMTFEPIDGGVQSALRKLIGTSALSLSFRGTTSDAESWRQQEVRTVNSQLAPGAYRLHIRVRDLATGAQITKTREFMVIE